MFKRYLAVVVGLAIIYPLWTLAEQPAITPVQTQGDGEQSSRGSQHPAPSPLPALAVDPAKSSPRPEAKPGKEGYSVGTFRFIPEFTLSELYDDNIYAARTDEVRDWVTVMSPTLAVKSDWTRHSLNFWTGADVDRYQSRTTENVADYWFESQGRYDISQRTNVYAGAGISRNHEDRSSLEDPARVGLEPTLFWETKAHLGVFHQVDRVALRVGTTFEHLNFDNVPASGGGVIRMDDRDRKLYSAGGRISFKVAPKYDVFMQAATDTRRYDLGTSGRNSDGYRIATGVSADYGGGNKAEAYVGHLLQDYSDIAMRDVSKPYFGADAKFAIAPTTYVTAFIDRTLNETTISGASSYLDTTVGARVDKDLSRDLSLNARLGLSRSQFQGIDRTENFLDAGFGARYYVRRDVFLGADYRHTMRNSNATDALSNGNGSQSRFDYADNQILFSVGYRPGRVLPAIFRSGSDEFTAAPLADYSGFYVGARTGVEVLTTEVFSSRTSGGTDEMDMGKAGGNSYGLFAGYGRMWNRWYYGLELESQNSAAGWFHTKDKADARTMSLAENAGYGLSLRLGYALPGGLLFGQYGLAHTDFHSYDTENKFAATGAFDQDQSLTGRRFGVGVDIPASSHLFVRMDYSFIHYGEFSAPSQGDTGTTVDQLDSNAGMFSLGLGWHFGGHGVNTPQVDASSVDGFYAGAQVGQAAATTRLDAIQNDSGGSGCSNCPYTGDFGKMGSVWGFFTGYGTTFKRFYAGLELAAGSGRVDWSNDRDAGGGSGGRDFQRRAEEQLRCQLASGLCIGEWLPALCARRAGTYPVQYHLQQGQQ